MTIKLLLAVPLGVLLLAGCATRSSMPFATATNCFYPSCVIDVDVVEEGGVRKLKIANDGNVRMGTRHRLTAIVWNLNTPGYEFGPGSIRPHTAATADAGATSSGVWDRQIARHSLGIYSVSVTNLNTEPVLLYYDLTVFPDRVLGGPPVTATRGIMNDP